MTRRLILLLGDQLTPAMSSLKGTDKTRDIVLMCEIPEEATYVRHHKKKIAFIFSAMRHFAVELRSNGWRVDYLTLGDTGGSGSFTREVELAVSRHSPKRIVVTAPGEWRVLDAMRGWQQRLGVPVDIVEDDRFLCSTAEFAAWAQGRKQLRMEYFYREMRRKTGLLMDGQDPVGDQWKPLCDLQCHGISNANAPTLFMKPDRTAARQLRAAIVTVGHAAFGRVAPLDRRPPRCLQGAAQDEYAGDGNDSRMTETQESRIA